MRGTVCIGKPLKPLIIVQTTVVTIHVHWLKQQDGYMGQSSLAAGPNEEEADKHFAMVESAYASKQAHCRIWLSGTRSSMQ
jgi:hypothetical protein